MINENQQKPGAAEIILTRQSGKWRRVLRSGKPDPPSDGTYAPDLPAACVERGLESFAMEERGCGVGFTGLMLRNAY